MSRAERRPRRAPFTAEVINEVKRRIAEGEYQHDIAADMGWNQGRVSEVNTGKRGHDSDQPTLL